MKRTRHTPEQIVTKLREADAMLAAGRSVAQVVRALGVSEQTFHRRRNQYGGMQAEAGLFLIVAGYGQDQIASMTPPSRRWARPPAPTPRTRGATSRAGAWA